MKKVERQAPPSEDEFIEMGEAFSRVIGELTEMRVRQRALLDVLNRGDYSWENYVEKVREVRKRDFNALFGAIVLKQDAFVDRFSDWIAADADRYLYETNSGPRSRKSTGTRKKSGVK